METVIEKMRMTAILPLTAALLLFAGAYAYAGENVTPYGDYCTQCTNYGTRRQLLSQTEAVKALGQYYADKGYTLGAVSYKGRFIEAEIFKDGRQIDRVILDRRTGRIRSIY